MTDRLYEEIMIELFKRVGLDMTLDQIREYIDADSDWINSHEWTFEECESFYEWFNGKLESNRIPHWKRLDDMSKFGHVWRVKL